MIDALGKCPKCNASWAGDGIFETLRPQGWCKDKSDEELWAYIKQAYAPPYRFSRLVGVEIPENYDGVWEWACPDCRARFPRFGTPEQNHG